MEDFGMILFLVAGLAFWVFLIMGIISMIRKTGKGKAHFIKTAIAFAASILGFIIFGVSSDASEAAPTEESTEAVEQKEETPEEKAEREAKEKAEAEAKAKEEAEAKAKAEAEAKAQAEAEAKAQAEAEQKAKEEAAAKKANAKTIEYAQLKKNPDRHADEYVKYTGQILQILEDENYTNIRLAVTKDEYGYNYDDVIFIEYPGITEFVEEDEVTVYGTIYGSYTYTSQAGWDISIPGIIADTIE